ncbi:hypothetical protein [Limnobaculum parvum]|uniref:Uncharacterized protein n=1 Tax=Limnobaculum parvum TaxID=2172103 RepID=A0A2Y9TUB9_9GAMM|nr:hypothetical protein [Limnobaculum parvum]AWH87159.1 hypothetical protein HYN51_00495 [Limnobaculum parvum]
MADDWITEQQESDFNEQMKDLIAEKAAILILKHGYSRDSAINKVRNILTARDDYASDPGVYIEDSDEWLLDELKLPDTPSDKDKLAQVRAIATDIRNWL